MMKITKRIQPGEAPRAEQRLREAGLDFTAVDRCPVPGCEVCARPQLPLAA